jgi:hypothetical protein
MLAQYIFAVTPSNQIFMRQHLLAFSCLITFELASTNAFAQVSTSQPTSPLEWTRQVRKSVPATASFYYEVAYYDANRQPIADTLIAETDAKRVRFTRRDKRTNAPVGMSKSYYWPSMRPSAEGLIASIGGREKLVGRWTYWYDQVPKESNKEREVTYDVQGKPVPGTEKRYQEKKPGCKYVTEEALPTAQNKLTCQTCFGSSRTVVPVDLPAETLGMVVKMDIRDGQAGAVSFSNITGMGLSYMTGGTSTALMAIAKAWTTNSAPSTAGTNCYYYITTDGAAAYKWHSSKGKIFPGKETIIYGATDNPNNETRPLALASPVRRVYICVENQNVQADATLTLSVAAMHQACE